MRALRTNGDGGGQIVLTYYTHTKLLYIYIINVEGYGRI